MKRPLGLSVLLAVAVVFAASAADDPKPDKEIRRRAEIEAYFAAPLKRLAFDIKPGEMQQLRDDPRVYVEGKMSEDGVVSEHIAVKLKGSEGSFKPVDDKPGLTLNFDKYKGADRFHGQKKIHLNNGNEDPSFLREWLAGEIGRAAGMAAGRCSHALVTLNGKDKGLYVVREGFTKDFLSLHFGDDTGSLFEGRFCKDIDPGLELDSGDEAGRERLKELLAACDVPGAAERWERLGKVLDVETYATYLALEQAIDFSDGYDFNLNNYRLYVLDGKVRFVMHGMDQVFQGPDVSLQRISRGRVGQAFINCPQGRELYRKKVALIYQEVLLKHDWPALLMAKAEVLQASLQAAGSRKAREIGAQAETLRDIVAKRIKNVGAQLQDWPQPLTFGADGVVALSRNWREENENGAAAELNKETPDGQAALHVRAKDQSTASWRHAVLLPPGRYRFEGTLRAAGVEAVQDEKGKGAGLRIAGAERKNAVAGDADWTEASYEFEVDGTREVILVAELRARKGDAWFARDSLRLRKLN